MFRLGRIAPEWGGARPAPVGRARLLLTLSNTLMLMGVVLLLYVGGLYANAEYGRYAARGDTDLPAPQPVAPRMAVASLAAGSIVAEPAPFVPASSVPAAPDSAPDDGRVTSLIPAIAGVVEASTVTRIVIPAIDVDSKVVSVGWEVQEQKGRQIAVWQVAEYAVGHHFGSANPGDGSNIVLAGHVGGFGKVFRDLIKLEPGDRMTLYSAGEQHQYVVSQKIIVDEERVSAAQQAENARFIEPTDREMITMVTCWPPTGKDRFSQRIIVRALPIRGGEGDLELDERSVR